MEQKVSRNSFRNFGSPLEVVLFSGNLEIPENSCSIWHFYPVSIGPSSFSREKLQDGSESFESTLHWMQNDLPKFESFLDRLFSTKLLGSDFLENCGLGCSEFPVGQLARFAYSPARKVHKFLS